ncbi:Nucleic-acid-binding protein from transposon X-element [Eumeta japonica]|uniref:Nucleic-acid-binding protein from transposon X-element n=1 Tax=Eumeta variegata TaxID=151549 RepID=A0A4C1UE98_EUMVA|nr:Nucleic-acid-binding protein from transposon X-element [Eumeta japonica]
MDTCVRDHIYRVCCSRGSFKLFVLSSVLIVLVFRSRYCISGPTVVGRFLARARPLRALALPRPLQRVATVNIESQGYAPPAEANSNLNNVGFASSASSREKSPSPSVCRGKRTARAISSDESSDEKKQEEHSFQVIQRKHKRSALASTSIILVHTIPNKGSKSQQLLSTILGDYIASLLRVKERKVKAVLKGIPIEFEIENIKIDLERQGYPVVAVHRMHRRDGIALEIFLIILERCDRAKDIFKKLSNVYGLSGTIVEAPYRRGKPGQCHRCQLYGHAEANCHVQPRCVKCLVPHWTKNCNRNRESGDKPSCCNCGKDHTANYGGCSVAPKPKTFKQSKFAKHLPTDKSVEKNQFPPLKQGIRQSTRVHSNFNPRLVGGNILQSALLPPRTNGRNCFHGSTGIKYLLNRVLLNLSQISPGQWRPRLERI